MAAIRTAAWYFSKKVFSVYSKGNVNILVTSRPVPDITAEFEGRDNSARLEIRASDEDVTKSLKSLIKTSGNATLKRNEGDIIAMICSLVDGMFLLLNLYFETIKKKVNFNAVQSVLGALVARKNNNLANGIISESALYDSAYEDAMKRINGHDDDAKILALRTLGWLTFAQRPLDTIELRHALAVDLKDDSEHEIDENNISESETIIAVCTGLVIVDQESNIIRLAHYTTQEFFERTRTKWFPNAPRDCTLTCLRYMSYNTFRLGPTPDQTSLMERLNSNPLYRYAVDYWTDHYQTLLPILDNTIEMSLLVQQFLSDDDLRLSAVQVKVLAPGFTCPANLPKLHLAAFLGLKESTTAFIESRADVNAQDDYGRTPLSWAANQGQQAVVQLLLESKADINAKDIINRTPLSLAAKQGHDSVVRLLIDAKADINLQDNFG